jgi:2-hydroxychromene-2-carboxylate isomerase
MAQHQIDFWFTMGSTYSYLSIMRLGEVERSSGISFRWRPFYLRQILEEMDHIPFANKPAKQRYMGRDIERRAAMYAIPAKLPAPYPVKDSKTANLIATVGMREGWGAAYVRAAYRYWFERGEEVGSEPNTSRSLRDIGQDPVRVLALAPEADDRLMAATDEARQLGLFGAPNFVVGAEIFWGDDRLEDAINWLQCGRVRRA